jgi:alpha-glucosidase
MLSSRSLWLVFAFSSLAAPWSRAVAAEQAEVKSPNGEVRIELRAEADRLTFAVRLAGRSVIEPSPLGLTIDGTDLGQGVELGGVEPYQFDEPYPTRGVHSVAVNRGNGMRVHVRHGKSGTGYTVEARAFNDGVAFRTIVPGDDRERVPNEATAYRLAPGSTVWYHNLRGHYEGVHAKKVVEEVQNGDWAGVPLTFKLPSGAGYASISESVLGGFPGMALQADGRSGFAARLGHAHPASYPFTLRYKDDVERVARPAALRGVISTPWRVVMTGADLNTLVNSDIVNNLAPPPDPGLFPKGLETDWVRPGRAVWKFLDGGESSLDGMNEFSKLASELGFEYNVLEGFWQRWSPRQLRDFVDASKSRGVGIWLWKHSKELRTSEARRAFFETCQQAGAVGAKIDFFDHEAKEVVDLYTTVLREAAEHQLMVDFHGSNKPTGESRTWPNELGREGIYGMEHKGMNEWSRHNATVPFTRLLAGHADYTPVLFGERRRETSWSHQVATAVVMTSPLLVYAAHPRNLLENPASDMIKSIPCVWDETIVLQISEIGERAAYARRKGDRWFLAIVNGPTAAKLSLPPSFLGSGEYRALLVRDCKDDPAAMKIEEATVTKEDSISIDLRAGGGFVARFTKP